MNDSERARVYTYLVISRASQPEQVIVWDTLKIRIGRNFEQDIVLENPESALSVLLKAISIR